MALPVPPVSQGVIRPPPPPSANMPPRVERRVSKDEPAEVPAWAATLDAVDQADANSTQTVAEYAADICTNLREVEAGLPKLDGSHSGRTAQVDDDDAAPTRMYLRQCKASLSLISSLFHAELLVNV